VQGRKKRRIWEKGLCLKWGGGNYRVIIEKEGEGRNGEKKSQLLHRLRTAPTIVANTTVCEKRRRRVYSNATFQRNSRKLSEAGRAFWIKKQGDIRNETGRRGLGNISRLDKNAICSLEKKNGEHGPHRRRENPADNARGAMIT